MWFQFAGGRSGLSADIVGAWRSAPTARGIGLLAAGASTGFAALAVGLGAAYAQSPNFLLRHPGPAVLTATAALAWWGAL